MASLLSPSGFLQQRQAYPPPNVVLVFVDDMGYGDLSCYGNPMVNTKHIDRIAKEGIKFTQFYVNSPICSPSRVALNTGRYPMRYKIHSYIASSEQNERRAMAHFLDPAAPTLAKTLQSIGYTTGHFGKWHMGGGRDLGEVPHPFEYGFGESLVSFEGIGDRVLFPNDGLCKQSAKLERGEITWAAKAKSTSIYVDRALDFVKRSGDQPFYVNLCPNDVHDPFLPDSATWEKWKTSTNNPFEQKFFAVLEEMDSHIGRLVDGLKEMGKWENTLFLLASDNGPTDWAFYYTSQRYPESYKGQFYPPGFTGGLRGRKWSLYEGGIREPLIVSWPLRIPRAKVDTTTVIAAFDLFPSLCSILGIPLDLELDGTDKSQALLGSPLSDVPAIMWEYASNPGGSIAPGDKGNKSPNLAVREGKWKLLANVDGSQLELYDLANDPMEKDNLAEQHPSITHSLYEKLLSWRKEMPVALHKN